MRAGLSRGRRLHLIKHVASFALKRRLASSAAFPAEPMMTSALLALADDLAADRFLSADDALRMRKEIFPDGVVSRQEAEVLMALDSRVGERNPAWVAAFVEALVDHALQCGIYPGHVDEETGAWLEGQFASDAPRHDEVLALVRIMEFAESTPASFQSFTRSRLAVFVAGRAMDEADIDLLRRCVYAGAAVTNVEVDWLFAVDASTDGRAHCAAWRDLFVKVGLAHVAGRRAPAALEQDVMVQREARFANRPNVTPMSVIKSIFGGGLSGYKDRVSEPGWAEGMEERYEVANAETEDDARFTAAEAAIMLRLADRDGRHTANEQALLAALRQLEIEQAAQEDWH